MTSTRKARPASRWAGFLGAAALVAPGLAQAQIQDLVYERTVMTAANARCGLFTPEISAALAAAQAQAHGAALRSGVAADDLVTLEERARDRAATAGCASNDLVVASARVRSAFAAYAKVERMDYPGEWSRWRADRTGIGSIRWRLSEDVRFGASRMVFGLAGRNTPGVLMAVAEFPDGPAPYAAQLLVRDPERAPLPVVGRIDISTRPIGLEHRLPARIGLKVFGAEARSPAGQDLLPKGRDGWAFRFPPEAIRALTGLDPREAVAVEFLFPGDTSRRAYVEVGDFAAGRAFVSLSAR